MTNPWKEMQTGELYAALLSEDPEIALKQLQASKRALMLSANRARIKAGKKLMNYFHWQLMNFIERYQDDEEENYIEAMRELTAGEVIDNIRDDKLDELLKDYMEYCYD